MAVKGKDLEAEHIVDKNKNPALNKHREEGPWAFLRKGWFWGTLLAVVAVSVVTPLALRAQRNWSADVTGPPTGAMLGVREGTLGPPGGQGWGSSGHGGGTPDAGGTSAPPSCQDLAGELPTEKLTGGRPPAPLRVEGGRLVTAQGGSPVTLAGITWPGFDSGATFVAGLAPRAQPSWNDSDFATAVARLRLLGFNAVRLPFTFDGLQSAPQDVAVACPSPPPTLAALSSAAVDPERPPAAGAALRPPPEPYMLPGPGAGGQCNGYVPRGPTTLSRLLWTAEFLARAGLYVTLDYRPPAATPGAGAPASAAPAELTSPGEFARAWQRLGAALVCSPAWKAALSGRIALDLLSGPAAGGLTWRGERGGSPAGDYYLAALDALDAAGAGGALFMLAGGGAPGGGAPGGGMGSPPAAGFMAALAGRPYRTRVVVAPGLAAAPAASGALPSGPQQWASFAANWGDLQSKGACSKAGGKEACAKYAVAAELGGRLDDAAQAAYLGDAARFLTARPPADKAGTRPVAGWFWWSYVADSTSSGVVAADGLALQWPTLRWLGGNLGLTPWYARQAPQQAKADSSAAP
ncbi:MAG: hypothetical protein J3K34DRAFT_135487 [Monoraphidium minutum]|nr:MAG: hypothetical protein J3K34DRAFT_135487 [Monoraphidium minutum]